MKKILLLLTVTLFMLSCSDDNPTENDNTNKQGQVEMKVYPNNENKISFHATVTKVTIDWGDGSIEKFTPHGLHGEFSHEYRTQNLYTIKVVADELVYYAIGTGTYNELRFGDCPYLQGIGDCSGKGLKVLSIKSTQTMSYLNCDNNLLTSLDLGECAFLSRINCKSNQLTSLDVSKCPNLSQLECDYNQLTSLIVNNPELSFLTCRSNQLTATALNNLFEALPAGSPSSRFIYFFENPGAAGCDRNIFMNKGWWTQ